MKIAITFRGCSMIWLVRNLLVGTALLADAFPAAAAAQFCADTFHMLKQIGKEGYDGSFNLEFGPAPGTPLHPETFTNFLREVDEEPFRKAMAVITNAQAQPALPKYKVFWCTNYERIMMEVAYKNSGFSDQQINRFCDHFRQYANDREQGHSRGYALASLQEYQDASSLRTLSLAAEEFCRRYRIPTKWLRRNTNGESYVIDGPIAWVYGPEAAMGFPPSRVDAQEFDPRVRPILDAARKEVSESPELSKSLESYYRHVQRVLGARHGINWITPLELNPGMHVDFAPQRGRLTNGLSQ
jgi:hypothetical protein